MVRMDQSQGSGTVTAADIIGATAQGISASEFAEIIVGMRSGVAYANAHKDKHASGEIRGQIKDARSE